jgi:DNA-binding FadR family transcriptional regulator
MHHAEKSDIRSLQDNVVRARKKVDGNILATEENIQFHELLAKASKNHVFVIVAGSILAVLRELLSRLTLNLKTSNDAVGYNDEVLKSKNAVGYHEDILNAIIEKRRDEAIHLLERHLLEVRNRLRPLFNP